MRILLLSIAEPGDYSSGGNQRSNHIRNVLLGIAEVDTIAFTREGASFVRQEWDDQRVAQVNVDPSAGRWERVRLRRAAKRMIAAAEAANAYDYIVARYFGNAALVPYRAHRKMVVDGDDLRQTGEGRSLVRRALIRIRAAVIRAVAKRMFRIWLVDPRDSTSVPGARVSMLPNTAGRAQPVAADSPKIGRRILMVGMYPYPPNEEGLIWFVRMILPRVVTAFPDVEFHAVGRYYKQELSELGGAVRMRGFVDDLAEEYRQADVVVCPIMSGSGTQIKVVEALMNGRPAVVSNFSYQGFSDVLTPDVHLLVARDEDEWVRHISAVLHHPDRFAAMAVKGREAAEQAYSIEAFSRRVAATWDAP